MNNQTAVQTSKPFNADEYSLSNFITVQSTDLLQKTALFSDFLGDATQKGYGQPYLQEALSVSAGRIALKQQSGARQMIQMNTANYLGLALHPHVKQTAHRAIEQYGTSTGGVPLIAGTTDLHKSLERALASFKGVEVSPTGIYYLLVWIRASRAKVSALSSWPRCTLASMRRGSLLCWKLTVKNWSATGSALATPSSEKQQRPVVAYPTGLWYAGLREQER
ncbi:MAG TPA: hypothetical protein P5121_22335 [Caldilineaceae bacterium]|nr:hypothetical protein [Caldilineaceae bacterium]